MPLCAIPRVAISPEFSATAAKHGYGFVVGYAAFAAITLLLGLALTIINTVEMFERADGFIFVVITLTSILVALSPLLRALRIPRRHPQNSSS